MKPPNNILPMDQRRYEDVPIDKVKVINSRNRDKEQFDMNVQSIGNTGLMKPIRVNDSYLESTGFYELITGNRMVNPLSASQEMRMLRKSLEELDEKTIASALGMQGIAQTKCSCGSLSSTRKGFL